MWLTWLSLSLLHTGYYKETLPILMLIIAMPKSWCVLKVLCHIPQNDFDTSLVQIPIQDQIAIFEITQGQMNVWMSPHLWHSNTELLSHQQSHLQKASTIFLFIIQIQVCSIKTYLNIQLCLKKTVHPARLEGIHQPIYIIKNDLIQFSTK